MVKKSKSVYLSDHWTTLDALKFDVFIPALVDVLENAETPLTVGIFGAWGSGKTSLLRMLEEKTQEKGLITVWFTSWKYDRQEALWRAFILRVIDGLYPKENNERIPLEKLTDENKKEAVRHLDRLAESLYQSVTWKGEEYWALDAGKTAKEIVKLPFWLMLHLAKLGDAAKDLGIQPDLADLVGREAQTHYMRQLTSMELFEHSFADAVEKILGPDGRLVVFVDDLDRCLPEKAVEILEAIKLFLHVPQTIFVLGMDREIVHQGIECYYGAHFQTGTTSAMGLPIDGDVYLQKLIQLPFNLPPMDIKGREQFVRALEQLIPPDSALDNITREVFVRGLIPNPRQVKRALNVFNLLHKIVEEQERQEMLERDSVAWPLLAKTVLIQSQWPELYSLWRQYPTLIQTLEEEYSRQPLSERELITGQRPDVVEGVSERDGKSTETHPNGALERPAAGGLLAPYLNERHKYVLLVELLNYPQETGSGNRRARFANLTRSQMQVYLGLAGSAERETARDGDVSLASDLSAQLQSGDPAMLNEALAKIGETEPDSKGKLHRAAVQILVQSARDASKNPQQRAATADAADPLGYIPEDLSAFVKIGDMYFGKYPVTNRQYERFLKAANFKNKTVWSDFPQYSQPNNNSRMLLKGNTGEQGWEWLQGVLIDEDNHVEDGVIYPRFWRDLRFGVTRTSAPVVGVSWWEANAYCRWLCEHWNEVEEGRQDLPQPNLLRLPLEPEWELAAGGLEPKGRYAWDKAGVVTSELADILQRANIDDSGIKRTTPVWMYPLSASPAGVMDLTGNVWEWQANYFDIHCYSLTLRGGSWNLNQDYAHVASRGNLNPSDWYYNGGFRVVSPPT